jgi:hypothetical protein
LELRENASDFPHFCTSAPSGKNQVTDPTPNVVAAQMLAASYNRRIAAP